MLSLLKRTFDLWCKNRWLKRIDREVNQYNRMKRALGCQLYVVNVLINEYENIYGEDLREGRINNANENGMSVF